MTLVGFSFLFLKCNRLLASHQFFFFSLSLSSFFSFLKASIVTVNYICQSDGTNKTRSIRVFSNKGSNWQLRLQSHLESDRCWFFSLYLLSGSGHGPQYKTQNFKHSGRESLLFLFVWIYLIEQEKPRGRLKVSKRKSQMVY